MSFIDMIYLRKKDLQNGTLSYRRHKIEQQLFIKWGKYMQEILDKYPINETKYLLLLLQNVARIIESNMLTNSTM